MLPRLAMLVKKYYENAWCEIGCVVTMNVMFAVRGLFINKKPPVVVCITLPLQSSVNVFDVEIRTWFEYV